MGVWFAIIFIVLALISMYVIIDGLAYQRGFEEGYIEASSDAYLAGQDKGWDEGYSAGRVDAAAKRQPRSEPRQ